MTSPKYNSFFDYAHTTTIIEKGSTVITLNAPNNSFEQIYKYLDITETAPIMENQVRVTRQALRFKGWTATWKEFDVSVQGGEIIGYHDDDRSVAECLLNCLSGNRNKQSEFYIGGKHVSINCSKDAVIHGVAIICEVDRQVFENMSLAQNITINMGAPLYNKLGFDSRSVERYIIRETLHTLQCTDLQDRYGKFKDLPLLPRHEQMKIIVARWLCVNPHSFIFINPLHNYDDTTAHEFYSLLAILSEQGYSVMIISTSKNELRRVTEMYNRQL
jgi:ABC-type sugar transport system ATPase subunit